MNNYELWTVLDIGFNDLYIYDLLKSIIIFENANLMNINKVKYFFISNCEFDYIT